MRAPRWARRWRGHPSARWGGVPRAVRERVSLRRAARALRGAASPLAVVGLVGANAAVFALWRWAGDDPDRVRWVRRRFSLAADGSSAAYAAVTHMFSHAAPVHLAANMVGAFVFCRGLGAALGTARTARLFLLSGLGGAAAWVAEQRVRARAEPAGRSETVTLRDEFGDPVGERRVLTPWSAVHSLGASGAVFGAAAVYACLVPAERMFIIFFPFVSFPIRALLGAAVAFDAAALVGGWQSGIGHSAHLGGTAVGLAYYLGSRARLGRIVAAQAERLRRGTANASVASFFPRNAEAASRALPGPVRRWPRVPPRGARK